MLYSLLVLVAILASVFGASTTSAPPPSSGRLPGPVQINPAYIDFAYQPVLPKIPGIDFLGWGYDATYRDQFYALKPSLFLYSYNNNPKGSEESYKYPTDTIAYAVPDQVYVRAIGKTHAETDISDSTQMQRMRLDLKLNLAASTAQFSGSLAVGLDIVQQSDTHFRICQCWAQTELYQLYLGTRFLSADVQSDMTTLQHSGSFSASNQPPYYLFLSTWGTHFVDSVSVGGALSQTTTFSNVTSNNLLELTVALAGKFSSGSGTTVSGSLSLDFSQAQVQIATQTTASADIYGGDAKFTDYLLKSDDPASAAELYSSWKSTLMKNPIAIRFRLVESWQLWALQLKNPTFALEVCKATASFLQWLNENPNYCNGVPSVLSSYIRDGGLTKGLANSGLS